MAYKLPDGSLVSGEGYTLVGDVQYPLSQMSDAELEEIGVERYEPPPPPSYDPRFYYLSGDELVPRSMEDIRTTLKAQVANDRWNLEQGSIPWRDRMVQVSREARSTYFNLIFMNWRNRRPDAAVYKFADGGGALANSELEPLFTAVNEHIQGLFDHEAAIAVQIDKLETAEEAEAFKWTWDVVEPA